MSFDAGSKPVFKAGESLPVTEVPASKQTISPLLAQAKYAALGLALGFLGLSALIYSQQGKLLYHPGTSLPSADTVAGATRLGDGVTHLAWELTPRNPKETVLFFHGNAGSAADRARLASPFLANNLRLVLVEYPGYSNLPGIPGEQALISEGTFWLKHLSERYGKLTVSGESLGAAVAAGVAAANPAEVNKVVLITPWDNLASVASEKLPWLPVSLLLKDSYRSDDYLHWMGLKTRILVAGQDEIIPDRHGLRLCHKLKGGRCYRLPGATHNTWFENLDAPTFQELFVK